jgi:hypothetical protein
MTDLPQGLACWWLSPCEWDIAEDESFASIHFQ